MHHFSANILAFAMLASSLAPALALTPFPTQNIADVPDGQAAPFVGQWAVIMQSGAAGKPATIFSTCALPVRIEAADETHIFQRGPNEDEDDPAIALSDVDRRTAWGPIEGGPYSVAVWLSPDRFNLYEADVVINQDWSQPMTYSRCD